MLDAVDFFDMENLDRFAQWADALRLDRQRFQAKPGRIDMERIDGSQRRSLGRSTNLHPMDDAPFDRVGSAVGSVSSMAEQPRRRIGDPARAPA